MRWMILMAMLAGPAQATDALWGRWGDARQCAGALLLPGGTVRAAPFELSPGWLRHGPTWCRLTWFPPQPRTDGLFASARALCGEDSARSYRLDAVLQGAELRLIWDETLINGPLRRCE